MSTSPELPAKLDTPSPENEVSAFVSWLAPSAKRDTVRGDLARDVLRDKRFTQLTRLEEIVPYLRWPARACPEAIAAMRRALRDYRKSHQPTGDSK